jgi:hypothetical protein
VDDERRQLSFAEELLLGWPFALDHDRAVCDRGGCMRPATLLLPGAYLCERCAGTFRSGGCGYDPPSHELATSPDTRRQRYEEYQRALLEARERTLIPRTPEVDELLDRIVDRIVEAEVDELIRDAGALP